MTLEEMRAFFSVEGATFACARDGAFGLDCTEQVRDLVEWAVESAATVRHMARTNSALADEVERLQKAEKESWIAGDTLAKAVEWQREAQARIVNLEVYTNEQMDKLNAKEARIAELEVEKALDIHLLREATKALRSREEENAKLRDLLAISKELECCCWGSATKDER